MKCPYCEQEVALTTAMRGQASKFLAFGECACPLCGKLARFSFPSRSRHFLAAKALSTSVVVVAGLVLFFKDELFPPWLFLFCLMPWVMLWSHLAVWVDRTYGKLDPIDHRFGEFRRTGHGEQAAVPANPPPRKEKDRSFAMCIALAVTFGCLVVCGLSLRWLIWHPPFLDVMFPGNPVPVPVAELKDIKAEQEFDVLGRFALHVYDGRAEGWQAPVVQLQNSQNGVLWTIAALPKDLG